MKLSKKILAAMSATALLATASFFTSCSDDEDEDGIISVSGKKATVDYTNESTTDYARAFKTLNLDRTDATCKITIDNSKSSGSGGVVGFMFNESKSKVTDADVTEAANEGVTLTKGQEYYDFSIAGIGLVQPVSTSSKARTYVSVFEGVNPDTLESGKNFKNLAGEDAETSDITKAQDSDSWVTLSDYTATNNVYTVYVKMAVQDDGSIKLDYYKDSDYTNNVLNDSAVAVKSYTIDSGDTGLTEKDDGGIGFYANIYGASRLVGSWEFFDVSGNAISIEE